MPKPTNDEILTIAKQVRDYTEYAVVRRVMDNVVKMLENEDCLEFEGQRFPARCSECGEKLRGTVFAFGGTDLIFCNTWHMERWNARNVLVLKIKGDGHVYQVNRLAE